MRAFQRAIRQKEEGGAIVESAILFSLLVPMLIFAIFFYELCLAKIKVTEASRFMVWEMTAFGLSDWRNGNHEQRFNTARSNILNEVNGRWGDDLEGASPLFTNGLRVGPPITVRVSFPEQGSLTNNDARLLDAGFGGVSTGSMGAAVDSVFNYMNFNTKGLVEGEFTARLDYIWTNNFWLVNKGTKFLDTTQFTLRAKQSLIADAWDLKVDDAQTLRFEGGSGQYDCDNSDYCKQISRMAFAGIFDKLGDFNDSIGGVTEYIGVPWPFSARVISKPLNGKTAAQKDSVNSTINLEGGSNGWPPKHNAQKLHFTNVFKDRHASTRSPYTKYYKKTGEFYMGCPQAQKNIDHEDPNERCRFN